MAKLGFTEKWLQDKGLVRNSDGTYSKQKPVSEKPREFVISHIKQKVNDSPNFEHKAVTEWWIPGNVPSKKNSRINFVKNGRQLSLPSKNHATYVRLTEKYYDIFGKEFRATVDRLGIKPPYRIQFTFVRSSKHSFDYCNACQTCEDLMKDQYSKKELVRKGWFEDDSAEWLIPIFEQFEYDKSNPGVRIKIIL